MTTKKLTKISAPIQRTLSDMLHNVPLILAIVNEIKRHAGRVLLVGGGVRDLLLGIATNDFDCEVHDISLEQLEEILQRFGPVSLVGKSFGVLRVHGLDVDWSVPRRDSAGRKPRVVIDEQMTVEQAFVRRDLTMNAMGIDLITHELFDPFNGEEDLKNKILRAPDANLFVEDPLRFYRVMQFISRFDAEPDKQLSALCATMDLRGISIERIEAEFEKMLLRSKEPSRGIRWLKQIGRLSELLPELGATVGIAQEHSWHPEGDVFEHSMQALDAAALLPCDNDEHKLILLFASLCHDLGKATTSRVIDGRIRSLEHAQAGVAPTRQLLRRIITKKSVIDQVAVLVRWHMEPGQFVANGAGIAAYKRLAKKIAPDLNLHMLAQLTLSDRRGRNPDSHKPLQIAAPDVDAFIKKAEQAHVTFHAEEPLLHGRDLLDAVEKGPKMGMLLKKAYELQIDEDIHDKDELKKRVLQLLTKK